MKDLKGLEAEVKELIGLIRIDPEVLRREYFLMAEMSYRTHGCYRADQSVMDDDEFLKAFAENFMSLEAWLSQQTHRRPHPFAGAAQPEAAEDGKVKKVKGHRDLSDRG
jgi:hypothetical protein